MSSRQGRECGPGLSAWWNVLPFFFANYALRRRDTARRVLGAAGRTNERFHIAVPGTCVLLCTLIIDRPQAISLRFRLPAMRLTEFRQSGPLGGTARVCMGEDIGFGNSRAQGQSVPNCMCGSKTEQFKLRRADGPCGGAGRICVEIYRISPDSTRGVAVAIFICGYTLVADRTRRPAGAVVISS
jgi:hypothetical protein